MKEQQKAYSVLKVQSVANDERRLSGIATTPTPDRAGDIVVPTGAKFADRIPLLRGHMRSEPVGWAKLKKPTNKGIPFEAEIAKIDDPGPLRDRVETAWLEIKSGLVAAVSIGFRPLKWAFLDDGGIQFDELEIFELSLVTLPANEQAVITGAKSMDTLSRDMVDRLRQIDETNKGAIHLRKDILETAVLRGAVNIR